MVFALLFLLVAAFGAAAQQATLKGIILDTLEKKPLHQAVVSLVHKKDSTLYTFSRSDRQGTFTLPGVAPGKYVLLVSYPRFADYADDLEVKPGKDMNLGKIALTLKALLLQEVVVRSGQAIRIKGDTTEFTADSFAVHEGATVEDLLKKLPGLSVNSKGEITAQGKNVDKVLVDGEEFFGDDPTLATQNLSARAVDKVQVFDTKTEQQQLSGMTTGNEGKTVNIRLKESARKGAFGKLAAGTDAQDYLEGKALYNRFTGNKKISVFGTHSNLNTGSLNWDDRRKLGIETDYEYDEISGYYSAIGGDDNDFNNAGGLPNAYSAGGLFSNKWNESKYNVNGSYRYNRLGNNTESSNYSRNLLPGGGLRITNGNSRGTGLREQHAVNGKYEWKVDSLATLRLVAGGNYKWSQWASAAHSRTENENGETVNENTSRNAEEATQVRTDNQLTYKQLFHKKNRQLLVSLRYSLTDDQSIETQTSNLTFYRNGLVDSLLDQNRVFDGRSQTMSAKATYNEPLSARWNLVTDYSVNENRSSSDRASFNRADNGKYEALDTRYSNNFDLVALSHSGTTLLRFADKKFRASLGTGLSNVNLRLHNISMGNRTSYNFLNYTPQAAATFSPRAQTNITVNYRGSTRQPSVSELQPLRNNNDGLYEYIGNPDLKVGFNHNLNMNFSKYKVLTGTSIWANAGYNLTENAITNYTTYDPKTGRYTASPVNVNGNNNWYFYGSWNRGGNGRKWRHSLDMNANGGQNVNFINAQKGINTYNSIGFSYNIGYEVDQKYNLYLRPRIGRTDARSTLRANANNTYLTYGGSATGYVKLPWKFEFYSDVNADLRQLPPEADRRVNRITWNAHLARKLMKKDALKIFLDGNDLLNQNQGYYQNIGGDYYNEGRSQRISRYFLLRLEWSFNQMPGTN